VSVCVDDELAGRDWCHPAERVCVTGSQGHTVTCCRFNVELGPSGRVRFTVNDSRFASLSFSPTMLCHDARASHYSPGRVLKHAVDVQYYQHCPNSRIVHSEGFWFVESRLPYSVRPSANLAARQFTTSFCNSEACGTPLRLHVDEFVSFKRRN